jgi:hypothetical protein
MEEPNNAEWQAPPPPEGPAPEPEQPEMSEVATLGNIFIEPGRTFEDLRRKPRFIMAIVLSVILVMIFSILFAQKLGDDRVRRFIAAEIEKNPQAAAMSPDQKKQTIDLQMTIASVVRYALPIFMVIIFVVGGLLYWLGAKAMGGEMSFTQALSVFVYSGLPPTIIVMVANIVVIFLKNMDDVDIAASQRGLINANLGFFFDGKAMPVLVTLLSVIDVFQIWGWFLAALGLKKVGKMSSASAWTIVLVLALIGVAFRVVGAAMSGNPG